MTWFIISCAIWLCFIMIVILGAVFSSNKIWHRCSWCERWYSNEGDITEQIDDSIQGIIDEKSHGICPECARREMREFADQLSAANK